MPLKKVRDLNPQDICTNREHSPPMHMAYKPGVYEWTCPACRKKTIFTVGGPLWANEGLWPTKGRNDTRPAGFAGLVERRANLSGRSGETLAYDT